MLIEEFRSKCDCLGKALEIGTFQGTILISISERYAERIFITSSGYSYILVGRQTYPVDFLCQSVL